MEHLAELAFDYLMLIQFGDESIIDLHYSVKLLEAVAPILQLLSPAEQEALAAVARQVKKQIEAPPDEYGYQPGRLTSTEKRKFIDAIISKEAFEEGHFFS